MLKKKVKMNLKVKKMLQDAVIRRIEIMGQSIKNVENKIKEKYIDVPWKRIAGMRDILAHDYLGIDLDLTYKVATEEIPELKNKIQQIKKNGQL